MAPSQGQGVGESPAGSGIAGIPGQGGPIRGDRLGPFPQSGGRIPAEQPGLRVVRHHPIGGLDPGHGLLGVPVVQEPACGALVVEERLFPSRLHLARNPGLLGDRLVKEGDRLVRPALDGQGPSQIQEQLGIVRVGLDRRAQGGLGILIVPRGQVLVPGVRFGPTASGEGQGKQYPEQWAHGHGINPGGSQQWGPRVIFLRGRGGVKARVRIPGRSRVQNARGHRAISAQKNGADPGAAWIHRRSAHGNPWTTATAHGLCTGSAPNEPPRGAGRRSP